jgi:hypothetical protein
MLEPFLDKAGTAEKYLFVFSKTSQTGLFWVGLWAYTH